MRSALVSFGCKPHSQAEDIKRVGIERQSPLGFGGGTDSAGGGSSTRREASVVLIDRTLDLAAAASHGGSLLQRVRCN